MHYLIKDDELRKSGFINSVRPLKFFFISDRLIVLGIHQGHGVTPLVNLNVPKRPCNMSPEISANKFLDLNSGSEVILNEEAD